MFLGSIKDGKGGGRAMHKSQGRGMLEGEKHIFSTYSVCITVTTEKKPDQLASPVLPSPTWLSFIVPKQQAGLSLWSLGSGGDNTRDYPIFLLT